MTNSENDTRFIRNIGAASQPEIAIRVSHAGMAIGEEFKRNYLADHPSRDDYSEEELSLLGAAFVALAGSLPIFSYDLIRWTDETQMFDGATAMREYAQKELGMERVETPVDRGPGRKWSPMTTTPEDTAKLVVASFDNEEGRQIANEILAFVEQRERRMHYQDVEMDGRLVSVPV